MVIWTPRARADLRAIHDHIANDAPLNAKRIVQEMVRKTDALLARPHMGKKVPEVNDDSLREISLHSWRILYLLRQDNVYIVTLVHKRRDLQPEEIPREQ